MYSTGKPRMIALQHAEESMMIYYTVSIDTERNRQADRITISISRVSTLTRDKNTINSVKPLV